MAAFGFMAERDSHVKSGFSSSTLAALPIAQAHMSSVKDIIMTKLIFVLRSMLRREKTATGKHA